MNAALSQAHSEDGMLGHANSRTAAKPADDEVSLQVTRQERGSYEVRAVVRGKTKDGKTIVITSPRKMAFQSNKQK